MHDRTVRERRGGDICVILLAFYENASWTTQRWIDGKLVSIGGYTAANRAAAPLVATSTASAREQVIRVTERSGRDASNPTAAVAVEDDTYIAERGGEGRGSLPSVIPGQ